MTKITWLGEDTDTEPGPSFNIWNGYKFPKGEAVEIDDPFMIAKARANQYYMIEGEAKPQEAHRGKTQEASQEGNKETRQEPKVSKASTDYRPLEEEQKAKKKKPPPTEEPFPAA
jgi:hypothetical protein